MANAGLSPSVRNENLHKRGILRSCDVECRDNTEVHPQGILDEGGLLACYDQNENGKDESPKYFTTELLEHLTHAYSLHDGRCDVVDQDPS